MLQTCLKNIFRLRKRGVKANWKGVRRYISNDFSKVADSTSREIKVLESEEQISKILGIPEDSVQLAFSLLKADQNQGFPKPDHFSEGSELFLHLFNDFKQALEQSTTISFEQQKLLDWNYFVHKQEESEGRSWWIDLARNFHQIFDSESNAKSRVFSDQNQVDHNPNNLSTLQGNTLAKEALALLVLSGLPKIGQNKMKQNLQSADLQVLFNFLTRVDMFISRIESSNQQFMQRALKLVLESQRRGALDLDPISLALLNIFTFQKRVRLDSMSVNQNLFCKQLKSILKRKSNLPEFDCNSPFHEDVEYFQRIPLHAVIQAQLEILRAQSPSDNNLKNLVDDEDFINHLKTHFPSSNLANIFQGCGLALKRFFQSVLGSDTSKWFFFFFYFEKYVERIYQKKTKNKFKYIKVYEEDLILTIANKFVVPKVLELLDEDNIFDLRRVSALAGLFDDFDFLESHMLGLAMLQRNFSFPLISQILYFQVASDEGSFQLRMLRRCPDSASVLELQFLGFFQSLSDLFNSFQLHSSNDLQLGLLKKALYLLQQEHETSLKVEMERVDRTTCVQMVTTILQIFSNAFNLNLSALYIAQIKSAFLQLFKLLLEKSGSRANLKDCFRTKA